MSYARRCLPLALAALIAAPAHAQLCAGLPSLRQHPLVVAGTFNTGEDVWAAGGSLTWGRRGFVSLGGGTAQYSEVPWAAQTLDASSIVINVGGGMEAPIQLGGRPAAVCPAGFVEYETGPDIDWPTQPLDADGLSLGIGLSAGAVLVERGSFRLIPYAGIAFARVSGTVHDFPFPDADTSDHEYGGLLDLGAGFVFGRLTIGPSVSIPIGFDEGVTSYGLEVAVSLGGPRQ